MSERRGTKALELWCRRITEGYPGVSVQNMTTSWRDGLAFCAIIHHFRPDLIDFSSLEKENIYANNELAFRTAEQHLGIPALLDAEDMASCSVPDRLSILTYLSQFYQVFGGSSPKGSLNRLSSQNSEEIIGPVTEDPQTKVSSRLGLKGESCTSCGLPVFLAEKLVINRQSYHRSCFRCARCCSQLTPGNYYITKKGLHCCEICPMDILEDVRELSDETPSQLLITSLELHQQQQHQSLIQDQQDVLKAPVSDEEKSRCFQHGNSSYNQNELNFTEVKAVEIITETPLNNCPVLRRETRSHSASEIDKASCYAITDLQKSISLRASLNYMQSTKSCHQKSVLQCDIEEIKKRQIGDDQHQDQSSEPRQNSDDESHQQLVDKQNEQPADKLCAQLDDEQVIPSVDGKLCELGDKNLQETNDAQLEESNNAQLEENNDVQLEKSNDAHLEENNDVQLEKSNDAQLENNNDAQLEESNEAQIKENNEAQLEKNNDAQLQEINVNQLQISHNEQKQQLHDTSSLEPEYPDHLNPFADGSGNPFDEDDDNNDDSIQNNEEEQRLRPPPRNRRRQLEIPSITCNPFGSDEEDDQVSTTGETLLRQSGNLGSAYSSSTSLVSCSPSYTHRKKKPAPPPPTLTSPLRQPSPSPSTTPRSRKSKPAPPPPPPNDEGGKLNKDQTNRSTQSRESSSINLSASCTDKSKHKKGPAPTRPTSFRRHMKIISTKDVKLELDQIEMQQQGLEKQGVRLEKIIRDKCESSTYNKDSSLSMDVEELILELFTLVNEKNELFRRQAELILLRRQQRLEEEQTDIEYQVRHFLSLPEATKTDFDKQQEETLLKKLVEIVEKRNKIVESLEMDRRREIEEDRSIHREMSLYADRSKFSKINETDDSRSTWKLKKKIKKKDKKTTNEDADKDIDEIEAKLKRQKQRKWF
ncbi:hypothetical protein TKK_0013012 [Trichogramma kaykai]|uniref:MICAL-like protein 1 n=1 Tax=Trichogramma kaykai TaxID=54128 RepID=A0ABD2WL55_9HYME